MAGAGHVGVDAAVCAVGAAALLHGLVDLNVADEQRVNIKALHLGVGGGEGGRQGARQQQRQQTYVVNIGGV